MKSSLTSWKPSFGYCGLAASKSFLLCNKIDKIRQVDF